MSTKYVEFVTGVFSSLITSVTADDDSSTLIPAKPRFRVPGEWRTLGICNSEFGVRLFCWLVNGTIPSFG
jgi:hypothetical protein